MANDFSFSIEKHFGVLSSSRNGWTTELNLVSWNGRPAKFDIRSWDSEHAKMGKGITLSSDEIDALKKILEKIE